MGLVPSNLKEICDLDKFKKPIKLWKPVRYLCRLCIAFVQNLVFLGKK